MAGQCGCILLRDMYIYPWMMSLTIYIYIGHEAEILSALGNKTCLIIAPQEGHASSVLQFVSLSWNIVLTWLWLSTYVVLVVWGENLQVCIF